MKYFFSKEFKVTVLSVTYLILIYFILRIFFLTANFHHFENVSISEILFPFLYGIRFDLAGIFYSNVILFVLYNIPFPFTRFKWYKIPVLILFLIINILGIIVSLIDNGYFDTTERRLSFEIFGMFSDVLRMVPSSITYHFGLFVISIVFNFAFCVLSYKVFAFFDRKIIPTEKVFARIFSFSFLIFLSVLFIRGGFQLKPIRMADAFYSDKSESGFLSMNTTFNILRSISQADFTEFNLMDNNEAVRTIINNFKSANEEFISPEYPFQRKIINVQPADKMNVVVFVMESWSAKFCGSLTGKKSLTPFFDSLASCGTLFTNFYANGQRSIEGIPSIISSVPSLLNNSIINSNAELSRFRGLGSILQEQGYVTNYHHAATTGSMGFDKYSRMNGFSNYFGKESFNDNDGTAYDGAWGIYDEPFFVQTAERMKSFSKPFCSVIFSLSSHDPFHFPENRKDFFTQFSGETDLEKGVRYSDLSLREFFNIISKEDWFQNTLFLITADHTLYNTRDDFKTTYQIPLLIYAPKNPYKKINTKVSSQADILPTILDILKISTVHSSMGSSVLEANTGNCVFVKFNNFYCVISGYYVLLNNLESKPGLFNYLTDANLKNDISASYPEITRDLNQKLLSYLQLSTYSISKDKIYKRN